MVYVDGHLLCLDGKGNLFLVKPDAKAFRKVAEMPNALPDVEIVRDEATAAEPGEHGPEPPEATGPEFAPPDV